MSKKGRRGTSSTSNLGLPTFSPFTVLLGQLDLFEDRRLFNPELAPPARSTNRSRHRLVIPRSTRSRGKLPQFVGFDVPEKVLICVRRKIRGEVLHAKKKTGRRGQKKPRRGYYSSVSCKD